VVDWLIGVGVEWERCVILGEYKMDGKVLLVVACRKEVQLGRRVISGERT
jgi:hypothetical protein